MKKYWTSDATLSLALIYTLAIHTALSESNFLSMAYVIEQGIFLWGEGQWKWKRDQPSIIFIGKEFGYESCIWDCTISIHTKLF